MDTGYSQYLHSSRGLPVKGPYGGQGRPPKGWLVPRPLRRLLACMQRLMFPMNGFRRHFPFVTRAVTSLARKARMFRLCVAASPQPTCVRSFCPGRTRQSRFRNIAGSLRPQVWHRCITAAAPVALRHPYAATIAFPGRARARLALDDPFPARQPARRAQSTTPACPTRARRGALNGPVGSNGDDGAGLGGQ